MGFRWPRQLPSCSRQGSLRCVLRPRGASPARLHRAPTVLSPAVHAGRKTASTVTPAPESGVSSLGLGTSQAWLREEAVWSREEEVSECPRNRIPALSVREVQAFSLGFHLHFILSGRHLQCALVVPGLDQHVPYPPCAAWLVTAHHLAGVQRGDTQAGAPGGPCPGLSAWLPRGVYLPSHVSRPLLTPTSKPEGAWAANPLQAPLPAEWRSDPGGTMETPGDPSPHQLPF